ncbi:hypothetical protein GCM10028777_00780 [Angustibacter speluncae]
MDEVVEVTVDRLTLLSHIRWLEFEEPVFLSPGDRCCADLVARRVEVITAAGRTLQLAVKPATPDSIR